MQQIWYKPKQTATAVQQQLFQSVQKPVILHKYNSYLTVENFSIVNFSQSVYDTRLALWTHNRLYHVENSYWLEA